MGNLATSQLPSVAGNSDSRQLTANCQPPTANNQPPVNTNPPTDPTPPSTQTPVSTQPPPTDGILEAHHVYNDGWIIWVNYDAPPEAYTLEGSQGN